MVLGCKKASCLEMWCTYFRGLEQKVPLYIAQTQNLPFNVLTATSFLETLNLAL